MAGMVNLKIKKEFLVFLVFIFLIWFSFANFLNNSLEIVKNILKEFINNPDCDNLKEEALNQEFSKKNDENLKSFLFLILFFVLLYALILFFPLYQKISSEMLIVFLFIVFLITILINYNLFSLNDEIQLLTQEINKICFSTI